MKLNYHLYNAIDIHFNKKLLFKHVIVKEKSICKDIDIKDIFDKKKSLLKNELLLNISKFNNILKDYITENIILIGDKNKNDINQNKHIVRDEILEHDLEVPEDEMEDKIIWN